MSDSFKTPWQKQRDGDRLTPEELLVLGDPEAAYAYGLKRAAEIADNRISAKFAAAEIREEAEKVEG